MIGLFESGLDAVDLFGLGLFGGEFSWFFIFMVLSSLLMEDSRDLEELVR